MKIKLIARAIVQREFREKGTVWEVSQNYGQRLIASFHAVQVTEEPPSRLPNPKPRPKPRRKS